MMRSRRAAKKREARNTLWRRRLNSARRRAQQSIIKYELIWLLQQRLRAVSIAVFVVMATGVSGVLIARVVLWSLEVQPSKVVKDVGETVVTANCLAAVAYAAFQHASV